MAHKALANGGKGKPYLGPDLPAAGAYLWAAYNELDDSRASGMGFAPISESDLFYYARNRGFRWGPLELKAIRALDRAHRVFHAEALAEKNTKGRRA